jgi:hypothetical protein
LNDFFPLETLLFFPLFLPLLFDSPFLSVAPFAASFFHIASAFDPGDPGLLDAGDPGLFDFLFSPPGLEIPLGSLEKKSVIPENHPALLLLSPFLSPLLP